MAASRPLGFGETGNRSSRSAVPENPTVGFKHEGVGLEMTEKKHFEKPCGQTQPETLPENKECLKL